MKCRIVYAEFHEFIGFYNGLSKSVVSLDFEEMVDVDAILILGDNGYGKTSLLMNLHAMTTSSDGRDCVRSDKNGKKIIKYIREDGVFFECKVLYFPTKTGHTSKAYIKKITDNTEEELNPNGNIGTYEEMLNTHLGLNKYVIKLVTQSSEDKGYVNLTFSERKTYIINQLGIDEYALKFANVNKLYREFKTRINIIVDNLGKMMLSEDIEDNLNRVTSEINRLVKMRDKTRDKINEIKTRLDVIYEDGDIEKMYKQIKRTIDDSNEELNDTLSRIRNNYKYMNDDRVLDESATIESIDKAANVINTNINKYKEQLAGIDSSLYMYKQQRNELQQDLENKRSILSEFETSRTIDDLCDLLESYKKRCDELEGTVGKIYTKYSISDLENGYEIVKKLRNCIDIIWGDDYNISKLAIDDYYDRQHEKEYSTLLNKKRDLEIISNKIYANIDILKGKETYKDTLSMRPTLCVIDDCPFIAESLKWKNIEDEILKLEELLANNNRSISKIDSKLEELTKISNIISHITYTLSFYDMNKNIIGRLPDNNEFDSVDSIMQSIRKRSNFSKADKYDWYLEVLGHKDEYLELKNVKIPTLSSEIKSLKANDKFIAHTKNEFTASSIRYDSILENIKESTKLKEELESVCYRAEMLLNRMKDIRQDRIKFNTIKESLDSDIILFKDIEKKREAIIELTTRLSEEKSSLKDIENLLDPLTRQRELYKVEQVRRVEYQTELDAIKDELVICEYIRDSLSEKEGLPIEDATLNMDQIRLSANRLLSYAFKGSLYLEEFNIDEKQFRMPFKRLGDIGSDVKDASSAERSFIALCLMLAMIETVSDDYGIIYGDEIDAGFSEDNKYLFIKIYKTQMKQAGISQSFLTTHSREFYEGFNTGYILFPGHNLPASEKRNNPYIDLST